MKLEIPDRAALVEGLQQLPQKKWWPDAVRAGMRGSFVVFFSYIAASSALAIFAVGPLVNLATQMMNRPRVVVSPSSLGISAINYRDVKTAIIDRNLFNSSGEYPKEELERKTEGPQGAFDINAPCQPCTLNLELLGTIYLGSREKSLATVKEKGQLDSDVYRVGDLIIGSENAYVAGVDRNSIIINNAGVKECVSLVSELENQLTSLSSGAFGESGGNQLPPVLLEGSYVESELGPGFGKIINAARLVPNIVDSEVVGFKIFAIDQQSLFSKVGLQNGDVITQVNDSSLKSPDQGFALYEAFRNETEVRISVLRKGTTPQLITVRIK